ncbi:uncharacterized protein BCR38DRAFT_412438 [Pseudomassariella vexata]|uniref:Uncharacterized protein n=1 Tax=Pseudomassariella vexata TaxID=1141098 RepID=A0A1Y2DM11_9PEZI|nr:uncharacterized protein BCR38DRAFT_412438 [Pseudomassariella vexata]ORY60261.1 hypothetical protein BCR38DRAFT_412438 [Pseudomassariella vexata]
MQPNDELSSLFARNLTLHPQPVQESLRQQEPEPIIYSISQHYTHSAHVISRDEPVAEFPRPSSEPPQTQQPAAELILNNHGIDHSTLSASQMELFKTAEDSQKLRLIELWRICPPTNTHENLAVTWMNTTVEQEEMLAQLRYERKLAEEEQQQNTMSLDGTPLTPVQTPDGRWIATADTEPYMLSGYEALARREYAETARKAYEEMSKPTSMFSHFGSAVGGPMYRPAMDPVYNNDWARQQQAMENQYGAFQMGGEMEL